MHVSLASFICPYLASSSAQTVVDDSSSESMPEELSVQTPLLDNSLGLTVPVVTAPKSSGIRGFDSMFATTDDQEIPLGGTAQDLVNEP